MNKTFLNSEQADLPLMGSRPILTDSGIEYIEQPIEDYSKPVTMDVIKPATQLFAPIYKPVEHEKNAEIVEAYLKKDFDITLDPDSELDPGDNTAIIIDDRIDATEIEGLLRGTGDLNNNGPVGFEPDGITYGTESPDELITVDADAPQTIQERAENKQPIITTGGIISGGGPGGGGTGGGGNDGEFELGGYKIPLLPILLSLGAVILIFFFSRNKQGGNNA